MNNFKKLFTSSTKTANKKVITVYVIFTLVLALVLFTIPQLTDEAFEIYNDIYKN